MHNVQYSVGTSPGKEGNLVSISKLPDLIETIH